jgi:hypothetical protein
MVKSTVRQCAGRMFQLLNIWKQIIKVEYTSCYYVNQLSRSRMAPAECIMVEINLYMNMIAIGNWCPCQWHWQNEYRSGSHIEKKQPLWLRTPVEFVNDPNWVLGCWSRLNWTGTFGRVFTPSTDWTALNPRCFVLCYIFINLENCFQLKILVLIEWKSWATNLFPSGTPWCFSRAWWLWRNLIPSDGGSYTTGRIAYLPCGGNYTMPHIIGHVTL